MIRYWRLSLTNGQGSRGIADPFAENAKALRTQLQESLSSNNKTTKTTKNTTITTITTIDKANNNKSTTTNQEKTTKLT